MARRPPYSKLHEYARTHHDLSEEMLRLVRHRYLTVDDCFEAQTLAERLYYHARQMLEEANYPEFDYVPKE